MTPLVLALGASLAWGVADFAGPLVSRSLGTLRVLFWAQVGGVAALAAALAVHADGPNGWGVLYAVVYAAPYVPTILRRVAFLGMALWVVSELVARRLSPSSP